MGAYRISEVQASLEKFHAEMQEIHAKRIELARQEMECWNEFNQVVFCEDPAKMSPLFGQTKV